jgi:hypothetical protein
MIECAREGCAELFVKKTHNQKYHNDDCCKIATNERIMEEYYERKDQRAGKPRYCKMCGITRLSRYNDTKICGSCQSSSRENINNSVIDMLLSARLRFDTPA